MIFPFTAKPLCYVLFLQSRYWEGSLSKLFSSLDTQLHTIPQLLLPNLYCSVTLLPSADLHAHIHNFSAYSVLASKRGSSIQNVKVFSCLCADLIGKVERQSALLHCWGWNLPLGINRCSTLETWESFGTEELYRYLCLTQFVVRNSSLCQRNQLGVFLVCFCFQMKPQQHNLVSGFGEAPLGRSGFASSLGLIETKLKCLPWKLQWGHLHWGLVSCKSQLHWD